MINAYHLSDAVPAALFGMFALWAAASKRHWFVRTAVVAGALLITLLIPAFEVVIEFGIECLLVVAGLAVWRRRRRTAPTSIAAPSKPARVRLSLESLMLVVSIVAVVITVTARAPRIAPDQWYGLVVIGTVAAAVGLACVWIVCGHAPWWVRLLAAPLIAVGLAAAKVGLSWTGYILRFWYLKNGQGLREYVQLALRDFWPSVTYWTTAVGLGMAVLCVWLFLMRRAGWFDPFDEFTAKPETNALARRRMMLARCATLAWFGLVSLFPLTLLYRLLTPTPIPAVKLPDPNGYDDFVAAGQMFRPYSAAGTTNNIMFVWSQQQSDKSLAAYLSQYTAAFDRAQLGLQKACSHPDPYKSSTHSDEFFLQPLLFAMGSRGVVADRNGTVDERLAAYWDMLRVSIEGDRGVGASYSIPAQFESIATAGLWNCRLQLTSQRCTDLATKLWKLEASREPWQIRAERQRIISENIDWQWHLRSILAGWSNVNMYVWERNAYLRRKTELRTLIVELAIRAYEIDLGRPPTTLSDLVPKYLPTIPDDPYAAGLMKYRLADGGYTIYSAGPDGDDDGGMPIVMAQDVEEGDYSELFPPPISSSRPASKSQ